MTEFSFDWRKAKANFDKVAKETEGMSMAEFFKYNDDLKEKMMFTEVRSEAYDGGNLSKYYSDEIGQVDVSYRKYYNNNEGRKCEWTVEHQKPEYIDCRSLKTRIAFAWLYYVARVRQLFSNIKY